MDRGEDVDGDTAGFHFYPSRAQDARLFEAEGLAIVAQAFDAEGGWGYDDFLLQDRS